MEPQRDLGDFGIIAAINVGPVSLQRYPGRPFTGEPRYVSGQAEFNCIHNAALAGTIGTGNDKGLFI